ncbi:MAG: leucine-rich repeat domain-containing protein [Clostridia bacterium]|nr:leucine-rich repeat domain-containing protein [Clostridia bacterium]
MKKKKRLIAVLLAAATVSSVAFAYAGCDSLSVHAHDFKDGTCSKCGIDYVPTEGLKYTLNKDGTSYSVSKGTAEGKDIIIASEYKGLPVTSVGFNAFNDCSDINSITIPDSVTNIEGNAFSECRNLKSINIPDSVTSISDTALYGCIRLKYNVYSNVNYLGNETNKYTLLVKSKNLNLNSYEIYENTKIIYGYAFYRCGNLESLTVPDGVISIGGDACSSCSNIKNITIPDSVTSIGGGTFRNCTNLSSITLPNKITNIDSYTFDGCSGLTDLTLSKNVTSIFGYAFNGCISLSKINYSGTKSYWKSIKKDDTWNENTGNYIVSCSDGKMNKKGNSIQ